MSGVLLLDPAELNKKLLLVRPQGKYVGLKERITIDDIGLNKTDPANDHITGDIIAIGSAGIELGRQLVDVMGLELAAFINDQDKIANRKMNDLKQITVDITVDHAVDPLAVVLGDPFTRTGTVGRDE